MLGALPLLMPDMHRALDRERSLMEREGSRFIERGSLGEIMLMAREGDAALNEFDCGLQTYRNWSPQDRDSDVIEETRLMIDKV